MTAGPKPPDKRRRDELVSLDDDASPLEASGAVVPLPGRGSSTPAVWGERVFVLAVEDTRREATKEDIPPPPDPRFNKRTICVMR